MNVIPITDLYNMLTVMTLGIPSHQEGDIAPLLLLLLDFFSRKDITLICSYFVRSGHINLVILEVHPPLNKAQYSLLPMF